MKYPSTPLLAALAAAALLTISGCSADEKPTGDGAGTGGTAKTSVPGGTETPTKTAEKTPAGTGDKKYTAADKKAARGQMKTFCATCHGTKGKGDGPAGLGLSPKPRDWTDPKWQDSVTDQHLFNVIKDGGAAHGLSPMMAPNPHFQSRPNVMWALVDMVRGFRVE